MAQDLIAFTQGLVLGGELAKAEPKRLRYTLLHTAGGSAPPHAAQRSPSSANGPGPAHWPTPSSHFGHSRSLPETRFAEDENVIASALPHAPRRSTGSFLDAYKASMGRVGQRKRATRHLIKSLCSRR